MSAAEVLAEMPESFIPKVCRVFSNPTRYKILLLLDEEPRTFTALMKMLTVNPKVLNDHLNTLIANKLAAKSYAYNVYTLTPLGRLVKEALAEMNNKLKEPLKTLAQWEGLG